ncbi:MAG: polysaccharide deacetylase family protein [Cyclobacteriaceae bacterium]|nr:polysaccharide deacetylase family protein [Cyclobacteriaceae bacterium]MDH4298118.1 polysaccharide deacetylase family protein [Cyclobacteriaceae bacterium]MDH5251186.1 polysaccharide deacetylase family protein [Cyclobacteriaceae bacterium]
MVIQKSILSIFLSLMIIAVAAQQLTLQERLGYSRETKLVILHADDIGLAHAQNMATIYAMENGSVNSGSIMVPSPWFFEIASYAKAHPAADFGLHLTLTSEWSLYKWGPVSARREVPGLVTDMGYFHNNNAAVVKNASPQEVEIELRSQIERALKFGIDVTHLDTHMFCGVVDPGFLSAVVKLGHEYKVPVLLNHESMKKWLDIDLKNSVAKNELMVDNLYMAFPEDYAKGMENFYTGVLKSVKPGLSCILMHTAYDGQELRGVTGDNIGYGAAWRQDDFNFFTSSACKKLIAEEKITLITWREIRDKLLR